MGRLNCVLDGDASRSPREGALLRRESDVGISPHAVDQRSDWPATKAVIECHILNFSNEKSPAMWPLVKIL